MDKLKVGIVGATGYTGSELVRILVNHPAVEISAISSESKAGQKISDLHPFLKGIADHELITAEQLRNVNGLDLVFLALPHGISMEFAKDFLEAGLRVIDLSGDFRLANPEMYEAWYPKKHVFHEGFEKAAYGLPELFREQIRPANLVANPGCFPTGSTLALAPLIKHGLIDSRKSIVDAKTGATGAGIKPKATTHFSSVHDNFKAYGLKKHRHTIEIENNLNRIGQGEVAVQFTPHLLPLDRGILSTVYAQPLGDMDEDRLKQVFAREYGDEPFIRLTDEGPAIKQVRGSNYCDIYATYDERTGNIIILTAIDNLVKGASGAAVQNMNLMFGFEETAGLEHVPMDP